MKLVAKRGVRAAGGFKDPFFHYHGNASMGYRSTGAASGDTPGAKNLILRDFEQVI